MAGETRLSEQISNDGGRGALPRAWLACQIGGVQQAQQTFSMHARDHFHRIKEPSAFGASGPQVAAAHPAEVGAAFRNRHRYVVLHGSLSNSIS